MASIVMETGASVMMEDFDGDVDVGMLKKLRAASRRKDLLARRSEYARSQEAKLTEFATSRSVGKPHRMSRAALRTRLARGAVELNADMPSIVSLSSFDAAQPRRKASGATAPNVRNAPDSLWEDDCSCQVVGKCSSEVTTDEGTCSESLSSSPSRSFSRSWAAQPACGPKSRRARSGAAAIRAGKQRPASGGELPSEDIQGTAGNSETSLLDVKVNVKGSRAAARKRHLHAKRAEDLRAQRAKTRGSAARPQKGNQHRMGRAAARTRLARGTMESDTDVPSLSSSRLGQVAEAPRKPRVARQIVEAEVNVPSVIPRRHLRIVKSVGKASLNGRARASLDRGSNSIALKAGVGDCAGSRSSSSVVDPSARSASKSPLILGSKEIAEQMRREVDEELPQIGHVGDDVCWHLCERDEVEAADGLSTSEDACSATGSSFLAVCLQRLSNPFTK